MIIKLRNTFIVQLKLQNLSQALSYSIKNWLSIIVSFIKFASHELQTTRREGKSAGSFTGRQIRKHKFPLKRECFYYFQHPLTLLRFTWSKTLSELRHINIHRTPSPLKIIIKYYINLNCFQFTENIRDQCKTIVSWRNWPVCNPGVWYTLMAPGQIVSRSWKSWQQLSPIWLAPSPSMTVAGNSATFRTTDYERGGGG